MNENGLKIVPDGSLSPGVRIDRDGVHFGVYTEKNERPVLLLYHKGTEEIAAELPFPEQETPGMPYTMKVKLAAAKYEYNYRVGERVFTDPYAVKLVGREKFGDALSQSPHSVRGGFITKKFNWKGDRMPELPYDECVMYHLHVRGFTMQANSGVRRKGTFAGLREKLPYLKELGVNQLKLMPIYEFPELLKQKKHSFSAPRTQEEARQRAMEQESEEEPETRMNYWGYGPGFYFAPKASYAFLTGQPEEELKELVRTLHEQGMELILEFSFTEETDVGMIRDCLNYWAAEYHIDGFSIIGRDSLTPELVELPLFRSHKLLCNWYPDYIKARNTDGNRYPLIAESNDGFMNDCRQMLRGEEQFLEAFSFRLRQNPPGCAQINYMTSHDGFTLYDLMSYEKKHNEANGEQNRDGTDYNYSWNCGTEGPTQKRTIQALRMQQRKNAFAMMLFSQGTPMLLAGDEFGNSQEGNNNPYCHDSSLTWLDWDKRRSNRELTSFVRQAAAFRRKHKVLHQKTELKCTDNLASGFPDLSFHGERAWYGDFGRQKNHLGCMYSGTYTGEDGFLYIAWNFNWAEEQFALPRLPKNMDWYRVMDTSRKESFLPDEAQEAMESAKSFAVPPRTVVILEGKKKDAAK